MVSELITLPLRLSGKAARLWWRAADQAIGLGFGAAGYVIERVAPSGPRPQTAERDAQAAETPPARPAPTSSSPSPAHTAPVEPSPAQPASVTAVPEPRSVTPAEEPAHVSEEPTLVEELAEPGAEDGAGAELHVREPWEGYGQMSAQEVATRLSDASAAELAAVQLYETSNRGRRTILAAAARRLKDEQHQSQLSGANGGGSQP